MSDLCAQVGLIHGSGFEIIDASQRLSYGSGHNADMAAKLLIAGSIEQVICSGRGPVHGEEYPLTEAQLMADYLLAGGISASKIEVEDESTSAVGNWVRSVPVMHDLDAESVIGITAKQNIPRMHNIGDFVATRSDIELVGYVPSSAKARVKDLVRERVMDQVTKRFLAANEDIDAKDLFNLENLYEEYKQQFGLAVIKKFVHRGSTGLQEPR